MAEHAPEVAFYSEDRGLVVAGGAPECVLVVDPIDGTRPALAGLEAACVSRRARRRWATASRRWATFEVGAVVEIKTGERFVGRARRGAAAPTRRSRSSANTGPRAAVLGLRLPRPAGARDGRGARRADRRAPRSAAATFDLGSATLRPDARSSPASSTRTSSRGRGWSPRSPGCASEFERVGGGAVLNNSPYDLAAAALCLRRAARSITDASRRAARDRPLLGSGPRVPDRRAWPRLRPSPASRSLSTAVRTRAWSALRSVAISWPPPQP